MKAEKPAITNKVKPHPIKTKRNISIDLLKCLAMLMVVVLHATNNSAEFGLGNMSFSGIADVRWLVSYIFRSLSAVAVNCFVLITGYFMSQNAATLQKIIRLWLTVFTYSFGFYIIICSLPFTSTSFTVKGAVFAAFPIMNRHYWFVTCYFVLCLLSPFLNKLISVTSQKEHLKMLITFFVIFSVLTSIFGDFLDSNGGYSICWFIVLYFTAAYIKKYPLPKARYGLIYFICCAIGLMFYAIRISSKSLPVIIDSIIGGGSSYNSIIVYCGAVSLFLFFKNIRINYPDAIAKIIIKTSSLTFGVYLFHEHSYIRPIIWKKIVCLEKYSSPLTFTVILIGSIIAVYVIGLIIELARSFIFEYIKLDSILSNIFERAITRITKTVNKKISRKPKTSNNPTE